MSESESEDEDMLPELMYSPSLNKISTVPTEDSEQLLAIEASPHRDKVFKIATELLTTERTYVAVLHLIDQVIVHGVYLSHLSRVLEVCHRCPTDVQRAIFCREVMMCQILICSRLSIFLTPCGTVLSSNLSKKKKKVSLHYFEESGLPLLLIS